MHGACQTLFLLVELLQFYYSLVRTNRVLHTDRPFIAQLHHKLDPVPLPVYVKRYTPYTVV